MSCFYLVRAFVQKLFCFRYIDSTYWSYPGFPSMMVPYGEAADFYFSGHTGFVLLTTLYLFKFGYKWCGFITIFITILTIITLLLYRIHYSIGKYDESSLHTNIKTDIMIGLCTSLYLFMITEQNSEKIHIFFRKIGRYFIAMFNT